MDIGCFVFAVVVVFVCGLQNSGAPHSLTELPHAILEIVDPRSFKLHVDDHDQFSRCPSIFSNDNLYIETVHIYTLDFRSSFDLARSCSMAHFE